ncbi:hypothetical protein KRX51_09140 [Corynebacterium sp. TAE3-ERU12]|uniref:hypothetical protein n=1 Tax=Corynebacterium sp. TAE3-ERU12 TaxID=2849491 RepID=UPI001C47D6D3|nr:hypothetical protein [Corynebacterium sp. TAE3-ERU12]MBV7296073.1 hypothetical protein [Corynebacterium sp. TAE3-ERU12]
MVNYSRRSRNLRNNGTTTRAIIATAAVAGLLGTGGILVGKLAFAEDTAQPPAAALSTPNAEDWDLNHKIRDAAGNPIASITDPIFVKDDGRMGVAFVTKNTSSSPISIKGVIYVRQGERVLAQIPLRATWHTAIYPGETMVISEPPVPLPDELRDADPEFWVSLSGRSHPPQLPADAIFTGFRFNEDKPGATGSMANPGPRLYIKSETTVLCGADPETNTAQGLAHGMGPTVRAGEAAQFQMDVWGDVPPNAEGCIASVSDRLLDPLDSGDE